MKHAYLIIANRNPKQLQILIEMLDDYRNDIYVLIDKKSNCFSNKLDVSYSNLFMLPRININWGDYSQIRAELLLLKKAVCSGRKYSYFHLLSGFDLPIVSQDKIHDFFDKHPRMEFIGYNKIIKTSLRFFLYIRIRDKFKNKKHKFKDFYKPTTLLSSRLRRHLFRNQYRNHNVFFNIYRRIESNLLFLLPEYNNIGFASQWFSIDDDLAKQLIDNKNSIRKKYKNGVLVDEVFLPTFINEHEEFKDKLYITRAVKKGDFRLDGNLRYVNWTEKSRKTGSPEIIREKDYLTICEARKKGFLFARKFDDCQDSKIINKIYNDVIENKKYTH